MGKKRKEEIATTPMPHLSLATPPSEVPTKRVPIEIEDRIIRLSERLDEINNKLPSQKEKFSRLAFKASLEATKTFAICAVIFYALSFDLTQRGVSKAFEYLNFGQGSRTNFALHLIASQRDQDQFNRALNLVHERLDNILHAHFTQESGSIMTNASFERLEELRSYKNSAKQFKLSNKVDVMSSEYLEREMALFEKQVSFSKAKKRHGYNEAKALDGLSRSLASKDYKKALKDAMAMPSYKFPSSIHAKRIAYYGLHQKDRAALQTILAEHKLQK